MSNTVQKGAGAMQKLKTDFDSRDDLTAYIRDQFDPTPDDTAVSSFEGTRTAANERLSDIKPKAYVRNRNFYDGDVTQLSPYIRHGLMTLREVYEHATAEHPPKEIEKFIQELAWRDFWQRHYAEHPDHIWNNIEDYKTGYTHDDYADELPEDIRLGKTPNTAINHFIRDLLDTGYMHNHTRMYVAAYVVHWRRIKWQAGAKWFLRHLIDGDPASNNLSWQWVASTFANKPYIFNLENVTKYCGTSVNCTEADNPELAYSYEDLTARLFPSKGDRND